MLRTLAVLALLFALLQLPVEAVAPPRLPQRYALILEGDPLARQMLTGGPPDRIALHTSYAEIRRQQLLNNQQSLRFALALRQITVTGSVHTLLNAVFVAAPPNRVGELRALSGVTAVVPMPALHRKLNKALNLVNAAQAWTALGGASNAGAGIKIAILDTGIDQTHPGFEDPTLATPPGYPLTDKADDATYASNKIIVVRSFVAALAVGGGTPQTSSPDDLSARDRVGHGTAMAMIAAGVSHQSPIGIISGIAPKAWLGNYKIFGSPGVNDSTTADVALQALDAAFNDGMDIALLSAGDLPALWSPSDQGAACGDANGTACDPWAAAVSAAELGGMTIVAPAGNDGGYGVGTINTPGDSPNVITVGASTNSHSLAATLSTPSGDQFPMREGDGPKLIGNFSAPLRAVVAIDGTGLACTALPAASLRGAIALVARGLPALRGDCGFATSVNNASAAGAAAVLIFREPGADTLFEPTGLSNTGVPTALISADAGAALGAYLAAHPGTSLTLNPVIAEAASSSPQAIASFSSRGPTLGDAEIKPELVAPGAGIYTAAQNYDPNGDLYNPDRYIGVDGTSFAAALVAGAAALVKQAHPSFTPAQLKSAVTNTASPGLLDYDANGSSFPARIGAAGAGELNAQAAVMSTISIHPATVAFGVVNSGLTSRTITITNTGPAPTTLQLAVNQRDADTHAQVTLSPASLSLGVAQSSPVTLSLTGSVPDSGSYEGFITVTGGAVPLQIPYLYLVSDNLPASQIPLLGSGFVTELGTSVNTTFRTVDAGGVPVANVPVGFAPSASVYAATPATDVLGTAEAYMTTSSTLLGDQSFQAQLEGAGQIEFDGRTRALPQIAGSGVVDAASFSVPTAFAAGSYLTIFGSGLSENLEAVRTPYLPLSLAGVSVSFDVLATGITVPGRLYFVSSGQLSVQIPWELASSATAQMKVTLSNSASRNVRSDGSEMRTNSTQMVTVPIAQYSPAFFQFRDASSGQLLAVALDQNNNLITPANPAQRGHAIQFFVNGLGKISGTQPPSGALTPASPLTTTATTPTVTIGGQQATVLFSGLAPMTVGLYQVNAMVPDSASAGLQNVEISIGGVTSKAAALPVQ